VTDDKYQALGDPNVPNKDLFLTPKSPAAKRYVAEVKLDPPIDWADPRYEHVSYMRNSWLRVERHFGEHFDEPETVIELRLPWSVRAGSNTGFDIKTPRSYVIVFGRVHTRLTKHAWHVRGALDYWTTPVWL